MTETRNALSPTLLLGALGVVFGDIGTSPIYTLRQCLASAGTGQDAILGCLSMIVWTVLIIVTLKYVMLVMRADNDGEGGIVALVAEALGSLRRLPPGHVLLFLGIAGAALFYGDGVITPAISVLSAVEGLSVATPFFTPYVVPIALVILVGLFLVQRHGSEAIGRFFGPVMLVWFATLALMAIGPVWRRPEVFLALSPSYAVAFIAHAPGVAFRTLGSVFLAVTGAEALYADMGQFSRAGVRLDWCALVLPVLVLNYAGQAALVLADPGLADNPFFHLAPGWAIYPLVGLAGFATIIASQAVISGAFSMTHQAVQVGLLPRLAIYQTSEESAGQVYVPVVNWLLMVSVVGLVLGFRGSDALGAAYGIAVAGTMFVTTVMLAVVMNRSWKWSWAGVALVVGPLMAVDVVFLAANSLKILEGGYVPLVVGAVLFAIMTTWRTGRRLVLDHEPIPGEGNAPALADLQTLGLTRVPGTSVYLTGQQDRLPGAMTENIRHNHVLHDHIVLLTVLPGRTPRVAPAERVKVETLAPGIQRVTLRFGFADKPDVPGTLEQANLGFDCKNASFFSGRELPVPSFDPALARWRQELFLYLTRNAASAATYFHIPSTQVVELGTRVEL